MDEEGNFTVRKENVTLDTQTSLMERNIDAMMILSSAIASLGIISNLTVVVVFLRNKKLRIKIPNIFIINQVSLDLFYNGNFLSIIDNLCKVIKLINISNW